MEAHPCTGWYMAACVELGMVPQDEAFVHSPRASEPLPAACLPPGIRSLKLHWGWRRRTAYHTDAAAGAAAAPASALSRPAAAQISWTCRPAGAGAEEQGGT